MTTSTQQRDDQGRIEALDAREAGAVPPDFRLNRFCGCVGPKADSQVETVRGMGRRLDPVPLEPRVGQCGDLILLTGGRGACSIGGAAIFAADGDHEFRRWFSTDGLTASLFSFASFADSGEKVAAALRAVPGAWALVAQDRDGNTLLARDRVGLREMYYTTAGEAIFFSSNIAAFHEIPGWAPRVNEARISEYMAFRVIAGPETLFEGVFKLLPGEFMVIAKDRVAPARSSFWSYRWEPRAENLSLDEAAAGLVERIGAVLARLAEDGRRSFMMHSGGIDSSALLAIAEDRVRGWLAPFTLTPDDAGFSEEAAARLVSSHVGCTRHEIVPAGAADLVARIFECHRLMEQPIAHVIAIPLAKLYEANRRQCDSVVTGECADTLFGYDRFARYRICWQTDSAFLKPALSSLYFLTGAGKFRLWLDLNGPEWRRRVLLSKACLPMERLARIVKDFDPAFEYRRGLLADEETSKLEAVSKYYFQTFVQDAKAFDAIAAHYGLEVLFVYAHSSVRDFALSLDPSFKFRRGRGKYALRRAMAGRLPARTVWGAKRSGEQPVGRWMRENADLNRLAHSVLHPDCRTLGYFNADEIAAMLKRHFSGRADESVMLWQLVSLEIWRRMLIGDATEDACRAEMLKLGEQVRQEKALREQS